MCPPISDEIKRQVEEKLEGMDWEVDVVLTHTAPLKYEPTEVFLPMINQSTVDKSTEQWLDTIEERLDYQKWFCGHYHTAKKIDKIEFMYVDFDEFRQRMKKKVHGMTMIGAMSVADTEMISMRMQTENWCADAQSVRITHGKMMTINRSRRK